MVVPACAVLAAWASRPAEATRITWPGGGGSGGQTAATPLLRAGGGRLGGCLDLVRVGRPVLLGVGHGGVVAQLPLGVERWHAAGGGGGHGLAVGVVHEVAGGEHARHPGAGGARLHL